MREQLIAILKLNGIDPDVEIETDVGTRTAVEILESAVRGRAGRNRGEAGVGRLTFCYLVVCFSN